MDKNWSKIAIITDDFVREIYNDWAMSLFGSFSKNIEILSVPPGEQSKCRFQVETLQDQLCEKRFDRDALIVGLGGGVVCDLAGFIAATFLRGVDLILVPTTLLAMVDASIGGKCGVNTPQGKNVIGTVYFPKQIIFDKIFLKTLPPEELNSGMMEMIKAALICDNELFRAMLRREPWEKFIERAMEIKKEIVTRDPQEKGERRSLNFGHTVAHAIEKLSNYQVAHGRAVGFGLLVEGALSFLRGFLSHEEYGSIKELLTQYKVNTKWGYLPEEIFEAMKGDKKSKGERVRMVLLERIGKVADFGGEYCNEVTQEEVAQALELVGAL